MTFTYFYIPKHLSTDYQLFPFMIKFRTTSNNFSKCYYNFHLLGGPAEVPPGLFGYIAQPKSLVH